MMLEGSLTHLADCDYSSALPGSFVPYGRFALEAWKRGVGLSNRKSRMPYAKERHELAGKRQDGD